MDVMIGLITVFIIFLLICATFSIVHRVRSKNWPDGDEIIAGIFKYTNFKKKP